MDSNTLNDTEGYQRLGRHFQKKWRPPCWFWLVVTDLLVLLVCLTVSLVHGGGQPTSRRQGLIFPQPMYEVVCTGLPMDFYVNVTSLSAIETDFKYKEINIPVIQELHVVDRVLPYDGGNVTVVPIYSWLRDAWTQGGVLPSFTYQCPKGKVRRVSVSGVSLKTLCFDCHLPGASIASFTTPKFIQASAIGIQSEMCAISKGQGITLYWKNSDTPVHFQGYENPVTYLMTGMCYGTGWNQQGQNYMNAITSTCQLRYIPQEGAWYIADDEGVVVVQKPAFTSRVCSTSGTPFIVVQYANRMPKLIAKDVDLTMELSEAHHLFGGQ